MADLYFQYKRFNEALEQLLKAENLSARKPEIQLRIAEVHVQMGAVDKAIQVLRILVKDFPQFTLAKMRLGMVYYNSNNVAAAVEQWEPPTARRDKPPDLGED